MNRIEKNYYEILEINTDATPEDIYNSYNRARNAYSQDSLALYSLMSRDECQEMLSMIDEAYSIISDPKKRVAYDHARGIKNSYIDQQKGSVPQERNNLNENQHHSSESNQNQSIKKIVASNKYSLNYTPNPQFEQEIEQTAEFTGEFLKKIREYKNVDVVHMSEMTKVSKTYIQNIEDENYEKLPASVYVRGFVYQYAKCLKLNPDIVANSFVLRMKKSGKT